VFIVERDISVDGAPVKSNIWKSRYQPNVQLCMLYLTNETGPYKTFQTAEISIIECDIFKIFHTPPHLEPEMEMTQVEFFYPAWCA
jgi:hypothetical protein